VRWALAAARADEASLAFTEAASHLERLRQAAQDNGVALAPQTMVDLLVMEAAGRAHGGDPGSARALLDRARGLARCLPDPDRLAAVALGVQRLGACALMPRPEVVDVLEEACSALAGVGSAAEAQVTASLARELAHSVLAQRPRARPLSERALEVARVAGDPATLVSCLLARHDVVWMGPGTVAERLGLAGEIAEMAERAGDRERRAEGVLLRATALLELASPAFRAELADYLRLAGELRQPRYDYMVLTRRAALALLDGRIGEGERLIDEASALGKQISEPDEGNVRMSQTLGARWARGDPEELLEFAERAVAWWVGIPACSHAVAAGFLARAGALEDARRALTASRDLGAWREQPYARWTAGLSAVAAARLGDRQVCAEFYDELAAVADTCAVPGAVVCFMGSYAHWAGVAAAALGHLEDAVAHFEVALATHERLGARAWEAESCAELADVLGEGAEPFRARAANLAAELGLGGVAARVGLPMSPAPAAGRDQALAVLRRDGELWEVGFAGRSVRVRDAKGLHDLAVLLSRPGVDVHVLDLASPQAPRTGPTEPVLDSRAQAEYRRRLLEIEEERCEAERLHDDGRLLRLDGEREALLAELRTAAGLGGRSRSLGGDATERARKAVTSRLRDAIGRIEAVLPELGAHLDRSVVTGTTCRYQPAEPVSWTLRSD
jgi:tetratricopeptide (TPR) repeat protein